MRDERDEPKPRRKRPIASEAALHEMALGYIERFPCSEARLRRHLTKKVRDTVAADAAPAAAVGWIEPVVARLVRVGLIDDERYAASRARVLHRRGKGARFIRQDLRGKGVAAPHVGAALEALDDAQEADADLVAAARLARKRRLGPWSREAVDPKLRQRHLATLARAGFGFDVAKRVVDTRDPDALEALLPPAW